MTMKYTDGASGWRRQKSWCHDCHCWHNDVSECPEIERQREAARQRQARYAEMGRVSSASERLRGNVNEHQAAAERALSGGSNDYWKVRVGAPVSGGDAYTAECNDLIEALQMTYAEGNVFKAVWRHALARRGIGKQGNTQKYEAEKAEFFAKRLVEQAS
jgi:hypothetical protein